MKICSVNDCESGAVALGLCSLHYQRNKKGQPLDFKPKRIKSYNTRVYTKAACSIEGCEGKYVTFGLCRTHLRRKRKFGSTDEPAPYRKPLDQRKRGVPCLIQDCHRLSHSEGYCATHLNRLKKHGSFEKPAWRSSPSRYNDPLIAIWQAKKIRNELCESWFDLEQFKNDVGEFPGSNFRFRRIRKNEPYSLNNFWWSEIIKSLPGETIKETQKRREERLAEQFPFMHLDNQLKQYGVDSTWCQEKFKEQNGKCAICGCEEVITHTNGKVRRMATDHDHKTGIARGLADFKCNVCLGMVNDSVDLLFKMALYLIKHGKSASKEIADELIKELI